MGSDNLRSIKEMNEKAYEMSDEEFEEEMDKFEKWLEEEEE